MAAELRAERSASNLTIEQLAVASGVAESTLKRVLKGTIDVNVADLAAIAAAFTAAGRTSSIGKPVTPQELMQRAVKRAGGYETLVSSVSDTTDELADRRRRQAEAASMTVEELERQPHAATRDSELDADEPDAP